MDPDLMRLHEAMGMSILRSFENYKLMEYYKEVIMQINHCATIARFSNPTVNSDEGGEKDGVMEVSGKNCLHHFKDQNQSYCFVPNESDCYSVEEESNEITFIPRKNNNSSSVRKKNSNATVNALEKRSSISEKAVRNGFVLKKWNVVLKGNNLALVGSLYDENGRELNRSHESKRILSRKLDGSVSTIDRIYVLDGPPVWERSTDPLSAVKKLFLREFPIKWRQAVKLWKLELSSEKRRKASQTISNSAPSNSSQKNANDRCEPPKTSEGSSDDDESSPSPTKRSKKTKGRVQKTETVKSAKVAGKKNLKERNKSSSEESRKDNQASGRLDDIFATLDLDIPRLAFTAVTPSTLVEAMSKNAVRIGAHTPTLKTFADEPAIDLTDSPDAAPSRPKKVDVVSMRLASVIGGADRKAIEFENKKTVETTKITRKIIEGLDDSDSLGESDSESEISTSD